MDSIIVTPENLLEQANSLKGIGDNLSSLQKAITQTTKAIKEATASNYFINLFTKFDTFNTNISKTVDKVYFGEKIARESATTYQNMDSLLRRDAEDLKDVEGVPDYNQVEVPWWKNQEGLRDNYVKTANGGVGYVAYWNSDAHDISCTYMTLRKLKTRGLGYPFANNSGKNGGQWFSNCTDDVPKYAGANGLNEAINGQGLPVENIVLSFKGPSQYGHVMLIDKVYADESGVTHVIFSDNYMRDPSGGKGRTIYGADPNAAIDNLQPIDVTLDTFYSWYNPSGLNGAVVVK